MDAARGPEASVVVRPAPRHRVGARGCGRYTLLRRIRLVAYGARLEIVLGVKALAGSNPASSASCQAERRLPLSPGGPAFSAPDPTVCADHVGRLRPVVLDDLPVLDDDRNTAIRLASTIAHVACQRSGVTL